MRILYLYLNPSEETLRQILADKIPSNHLCGLVELQRLGYNVSFKDSRPQGPLRKLTRFINEKLGFNLKDFKTILSLRNYDVIVVKGAFSTSVTIACRLFNKKIVYLDTLFRLPRNLLRKIIYKINIHLSNGSIVYSRSQMELCSKLFNVPPTRLKLIHFAIDVPFFKRSNSFKIDLEPFVLSVGRDLARDYWTLVEAMNGLGVGLKIVTLPYLLKDVSLNNPYIEVLENLTYERLFQLYAEALFVVIPLKKWGTAYSSGTTSLLEAKALGKGVIATYSKPLAEYLGQGEGVLYVEPENVKKLREKIMSLLENPDDRIRLETRGNEVVKNNYNMDVFAIAFGNYLSSLFEDSMKGISPNEL